MGILDRLGNVIKSYVNIDDEVFKKSYSKKHSDPDLNAAFEELDDFLHGDEAGEKFKTYEAKAGEETDKKKKTRPIPEGLKKDFAELGLTPEATAEECKEAYKRLLKVHHPDRHAKHEGNTEKATEKSARVNASYDRLVDWFKN